LRSWIFPTRIPGPGQIRIVVHAAGINATEWKLRKGLLNFGAGLPQTTGRDVAGVVDEVGEGVTDVAVGDRVFGVSDDGDGAAELALLTYRAPIPAPPRARPAGGKGIRHPDHEADLLQRSRIRR